MGRESDAHEVKIVAAEVVSGRADSIECAVSEAFTSIAAA